MERTAAMGRVHTVCGEISTEELGCTLLHEHLVATDWNVRMGIPGWFDFDAVCREVGEKLKIISERQEIRTIGDLSTWGLGRDVNILKEISEISGVNIFCATGFYADDRPFFRGASDESMLEYLLDEITNGIQGTSIHPAVIKCATTEKGVTAHNERQLLACAKAQLASGLPLFTHTYPHNESGIKQQDIFERAGVDLSQVVIGHCGDTNDIAYLERILKRGSYIGLDRFGQDKHNPLEKRMEVLVELLKRGYIRQIIISHDHICYENNDKYERKPKVRMEDEVVDLRYIHRFVLPGLIEAGFQDKDIEQLLVKNPREIFEKKYTFSRKNIRNGNCR